MTVSSNIAIQMNWRRGNSYGINCFGGLSISFPGELVVMGNWIGSVDEVSCILHCRRTDTSVMAVRVSFSDANIPSIVPTEVIF